MELGVVEQYFVPFLEMFASYQLIMPPFWKSSVHAVPWDLVVSERGISLFPAPSTSWTTLILNTTDCHIFGKFQLTGYHAFEKFLSAGCSFSY